MRDEENDGTVNLAPEQRKAVEGAHRWIEESAAQLGIAYLEFQEADLRFRKAEKALTSLASSTRDAEVQYNQVMAKLAKLLKLGPGEWVYDGKGKLVRKDKPNAKST